MKSLFTIGEVAELFSVNIRTLRYYNDIDILHPETTNTQTGCRYYATRQFERLNTIEYLHALGISPKKIALFFESRDASIMQTLLEEQHRGTLAHISQLIQVEWKLGYRLQSSEDALHTPPGMIRLLHFGQRQVAYSRKNIPLGDDLEYSLRELERADTLEPVMFLGKVGVFISARELVRWRFESFSGIFVLLEQEDRYHGEEHYLMAGGYLTIRFTGTHTEAVPYYMKLLGHMAENRYRCCGDSVEITLINTGFTNDTSQYVTEIQIPVERNY